MKLEQFTRYSISETRSIVVLFSGNESLHADMFAFLARHLLVLQAPLRDFFATFHSHSVLPFYKFAP